MRAFSHVGFSLIPSFGFITAADPLSHSRISGHTNTTIVAMKQAVATSCSETRDGHHSHPFLQRLTLWMTTLHR